MDAGRSHVTVDARRSHVTVNAGRSHVTVDAGRSHVTVDAGRSHGRCAMTGVEDQLASVKEAVIQGTVRAAVIIFARKIQLDAPSCELIILTMMYE